MDFIAGNLLKIICHLFDLPFSVFRGTKGPIWTKLSLQQLRRPYRIHTPLVSANAVIMWCMECVWTSYRMRLLDRAPVCMGGEGFTSSSLLHLQKSLFCPLFDSMAVYVFVVCMYVSVWCGGALLSLSLWIVAGMVVVGHGSRGVGEVRWQDFNCGDADRLEEAIAGQGEATYRDILVHPNLSCNY